MAFITLLARVAPTIGKEAAKIGASVLASKGLDNILKSGDKKISKQEFIDNISKETGVDKTALSKVFDTIAGKDGQLSENEFRSAFKK